jgi:hypothetical protein
MTPQSDRSAEGKPLGVEIESMRGTATGPFENFTATSTPTQILRSQIEELEAELQSCLRDLEAAHPHLSACYPDGQITARVKARIEALRAILSK